MELKDKYFIVQQGKEWMDTHRLVSTIRASGWLKPESETVLVNCFPEYSSITTQIANHGLSHLNKNELFEQIDLYMPYPNMTQVWNPHDRSYQGFYNYMTDWVRKNVFSTCSYLFISAAENIFTLRPFLKSKLEPDRYRLATTYIKSTDPEPDFWVQKYDRIPLFEWENMDSPNWNY